MKVLVLLATLIVIFVPSRLHAQGRAEKVRAQVQEILASPEFGIRKSDPTLLDKALKRLGEVIEELFDRLARLFRLRSGGAGGSFAFWLILIGLIAGMGFLAAYALRRAEFGKRTARPSSAEAGESEPNSHLPEDWLAAAQSLAAAGDFRRAYRAMFRAILLRLDAGGIIRFEPSRTNGEYMRALRSNATMYPIVRPAADGFDILWYGRRAASEQDFRSCRTAYESVDSALA